MLIQTFCNSPNPVRLFKVKSHPGNAGDMCADAMAKYQAIQVDMSHADTGIPRAGIRGNLYNDITWLAFERNNPFNAKSQCKLKHALAQQCHKVSLHTILIGVMGTIYKCHTELPLSKLGLDRCRVRKLTLDLNTHSIQYATKIMNARRRFKNN